MPGTGALLMGRWAFLGVPFIVAMSADALGAVAAAHYNATWGRERVWAVDTAR